MPDVLSPDEEEALARELGALPFKPFDFHGYLANRQVVSFGYRYDYGSRSVVEAAPFPEFLESLRRKVAALFDRPAETFRQVLINQYQPGAGIGWHRDKAQFDEVTAVSLLAPCNLRFRRKAGERWERASLIVEPRSAYLLSGPARSVWEHSIPALDRLRYSITLRTLVASDRGRTFSASCLKERRRRVSKDVTGATAFAHWSILRDAKPRFAPQDEGVNRSAREQPQDERQNDAQQNPARDRRVEGEAFALNENVAGKAPEPEPRDPRP